MSAYIVEKNHVLYLVAAAMNRGITGTSSIRWRFGNPTQTESLGCMDYDKAADVANMLWRENIKSVSHRYRDESSATLPGPGEGNYVVTPADVRKACWVTMDAAQVLKSCHCYSYQTREHDQWEESEAKAFIDSLEYGATHAVKGYAEADWGAPPPTKGAICLSALL